MKFFIKGFCYALLLNIIVLFSYITFSKDASTAKKIKTNMENTVYLDLKDGRVVIRMLPNIAPKHVARIKELVRKGFYNGAEFYRVIDGFMAQCGKISDNKIENVKNIPAEFTNKYSHKRGAVSMARSSDPNSANNQFFIVTSDSYYLDGKYTIWGYVIDGMEYVDNIKKGDISDDGIVKNPDKIIKMSVASDVEKGQN
jgi:peptidylprolyl isomerase